VTRRGGAAGDFYSGLIGEFIAVQKYHEIEGGFPAFEDTLLREGVVRTGSRLEAFISRVEVRQLKERARGLAEEPYLWIFVHDEEDRLDSFVVDSEMALGAVEKAAPAMDRLRIPVPGYAADEPDGHSVRVGEARYLTVSLVEVEPGPECEIGSRSGIRFEVAEQFGESKAPPLCSFTMEPLTALLAIGARVLRNAVGSPSTFEQKLEDFAAEVEADAEAVEKEIAEEG
jgi:hypothetical protein